MNVITEEEVKGQPPGALRSDLERLVYWWGGLKKVPYNDTSTRTHIIFNVLHELGYVKLVKPPRKQDDKNHSVSWYWVWLKPVEIYRGLVQDHENP